VRGKDFAHIKRFVSQLAGWNYFRNWQAKANISGKICEHSVGQNDVEIAVEEPRVS
jgi:hypothetical protein